MMKKLFKAPTHLAEFSVFGSHRQTSFLILFVLCCSLISCATSEKNKQEEAKQVQPEKKLPATQEITKTSVKSEHEKKAEQEYNRQTHSHEQDGQQQTTADNYSSEIKSARTSREDTAQIDGKLDESLSNFDEMLLKKNEELSVLQSREEGAGGAANQGGAETGSGEQSGGSVTASSGSGQSIAGTMNQDRQYDNDDVVARQIREAAEKETDPELKKKLWGEYKKYKAGSN